MKKRAISIIVLVTALSLMLSGCGLFMNGTNSALGTYDFKQMDLIQLREPYDGQPMAIISTAYGEMRVVLYPEYAPNTVANFIARVNEGYYDGKDIFAIYENSYFFSGSNSEDGTSGVTEDGKAIPNECSVNLWPFRGSLLAYNATSGYGDSRFIVVNDYPITEDEISELRGYTDNEGNQAIPEELITSFINVGSFPHIAGCYTVFGQTIQGLDVIEKITALPSDSETMKPVDKVVIDKIVMSEYKSGDPYEMTTAETQAPTETPTEEATAAETTAAA